jgi:hypothetical protein
VRTVSAELVGGVQVLVDHQTFADCKVVDHDDGGDGKEEDLVRREDRDKDGRRPEEVPRVDDGGPDEADVEAALDRDETRTQRREIVAAAVHILKDACGEHSGQSRRTGTKTGEGEETDTGKTEIGQREVAIRSSGHGYSQRRAGCTQSQPR